MNKEILGQILLKMSSFPSLPTAAMKMLRLLDKEDADIKQVEKILRYEPGLTANVLKLANSPFFGIPQKVGSLNQAVILLGLKRVAQLVISACTTGLMEKELEGYNLPPGELWRHSIIVSHTAEAISKLKKLDKAGDVFTPALLHDLGKLALSSYVKKEFEAIKTITSRGVPFEVAENMILGLDHAEIGSQILRQWAFPASLVDVVRFHHNPERLQIRNLQVDIVYLANFLCKQEVDYNVFTGQLKDSYEGVIKRLDIKPDELELLSDRIKRITEHLSVSTQIN